MIKEQEDCRYPSSDDICYAVWLKNLALRLPAYASRYQLTLIEVLEVHCIALDYIDLLIHRMHLATAHIRLRQCLVGKKKLPVEEISWSECAPLVQKPIAELVAHIRQHPAYSAADAHDLRLPVAG